MPRGPKGGSRPADVIGAGLQAMRIATGEEAQEIASISPGAVGEARRVGLGRET
jgi:hypothetical protein